MSVTTAQIDAKHEQTLPSYQSSAGSNQIFGPTNTLQRLV